MYQRTVQHWDHCHSLHLCRDVSRQDMSGDCEVELSELGSHVKLEFLMRWRPTHTWSKAASKTYSSTMFAGSPIPVQQSRT